MARRQSATSDTGARRGAARARAGAVRDLAADWKRWRLAERLTAVTTLAVLALVLAMSVALGAH